MRNLKLVFSLLVSSSLGVFAQSTPTATLTPSVTPNGGADFGMSVAMSGSTVAATSFTLINDDGADVVFVFTKPSAAAWTNMNESATLVAFPGDNLTGTVAISGDGSIIVSSGKQGAYVFLKPEGGWQGTVNPTALLTPGPAPIPWVLQGSLGTVSINAQGDTIIAGAGTAGYAAHRSGGVAVPASPNRGAAYIFVRPAGGWANMTATAKLAPSDAAAGDEFGVSVAISVNTVLVGAQGVANRSGAAYLFTRPNTGIWHSSNQRFLAKFTNPAGEPNDLLGLFLGVGKSGALVALGDIQGCATSNPGHAFVYVRPTKGWPSAPLPTATLTPSDLSGGGCFGRVSVGSESPGNEVVLVGAPSTGAAGITGSGYSFAEPTTGWVDMSLPASMLPGSGSVYFGDSISVGGSTVAFGAPNTLVNGIENIGAVYLFTN